MCIFCYHSLASPQLAEVRNQPQSWYTYSDIVNFVKGDVTSRFTLPGLTSIFKPDVSGLNFLLGRSYAYIFLCVCNGGISIVLEEHFEAVCLHLDLHSNIPIRGRRFQYPL